MEFEEHVDALRQEYVRLGEQAERARSALAEVEEKRLRVERGLAALTGQKPASSGAKRAARSTGRGVTTADVVGELRSELRNGPKDENQAKAEVERRLKAKGKLLQGISNRWKQVLARPEFETRGDLLHLARSEALGPNSAQKG